jgi:hypothetical protein
MTLKKIVDSERDRIRELAHSELRRLDEGEDGSNRRTSQYDTDQDAGLRWLGELADQAGEAGKDVLDTVFGWLGAGDGDESQQADTAPTTPAPQSVSEPPQAVTKPSTSPPTPQSLPTP